LDSAIEANEKAPSKTMKHLVERLRNQLAKKEKEQKALSQALLQIRSDMVVTAEENVKAFSKKLEGEGSIQNLLDKETSTLNEQVEELQDRLDKAKRELKQKRENEETTAMEIESLKRDLQRKETALRSLGNELKDREDLQEKYDKLETDNKKLVQKLKSVSSAKKPVSETPMEAVDESRLTSAPSDKRSTMLNDLDELPVKETKNREEVIRWEEGKKWKKKMENLKTKLKEKNEENLVLQKSNKSLKDAMNRHEKDKNALQNRLKSVSSKSASQYIEPNSSNTLAHEEIVGALKTRIFQLEDQNNEITKQLNVDREKEIQELRIQISQQNETIHAIEAELMRKQESEDVDGYNWSLHREQKLQKEMLEVRKENMELRFENEQANKDVPRLKARVKDLSEYVEILKKEIENSKKKEKAKKHHPVYTVGIRTKDYMDTEVINRLKELDAEYQYTDRGGLITFHGPGQLVCYPVLNLKNYGWTLRCYIHKLEQVVMDTCQQFGVETHRTDDVGIWIGNEKIAAIGVHCQRHITSHGLALNCNTDLSWFGHIVPCGLHGKSVTSLSRQLDDIVTVEHVTPHLLDKFQRVFGCEMVEK